MGGQSAGGRPEATTRHWLLAARVLMAASGDTTLQPSSPPAVSHSMGYGVLPFVRKMADRIDVYEQTFLFAWLRAVIL